MKTFLESLDEIKKSTKPVVMAFGRMNPPTSGHLKLIDKVKSTAEKEGAKHTIVLSRSQDSKKNPLSGEQKVKHLQRFSPGTHFDVASKDHPTLMHHAARLHAAGHDHLIVVGGSDRVKEYHDLLHKYNGKEGKHGYYNFKKIEVRSAGHRDPDAEGSEGMSGTKMRHHAQNNDFHSFRQGVPHHVSDQHARELMRDTRKGMGLNENINRGVFKAIFVTGGPGSGKDIIIRECIAESKCVELNTIQAFEQISKLGYIKEVKERKPLIINGPAENSQRIGVIKEYLGNLGYSTMMVFVETSNEASQERNSKLSRMMVESIRNEKWELSQKNKTMFSESFDNFMVFDNNRTIESLEEDITDTYMSINSFLDNRNYSESAFGWLDRNNRLNINEKLTNFFKESNNDSGNSKLVQKVNVKGKYNPAFRAAGPGDITPDNRAGDENADDLKWDAPKRNKTYTFKTYSEGKNPTLTISPEPKEPNFQKDADKEKVKKRGDKSLKQQTLGKPAGVGQEYDTRAGGQGAAAGAGLGNQTYSESIDASNDDVINFAGMTRGPTPNPLSSDYDNTKKSFKKFRTIKKEAIDDPGANDMGVGGTLGGATNKEPMQSYKDSDRNTTLTIKKKKKV
jgi:predicted kinase